MSAARLGPVVAVVLSVAVASIPLWMGPPGATDVVQPDSVYVRTPDRPIRRGTFEGVVFLHFEQSYFFPSGEPGQWRIGGPQRFTEGAVTDKGQRWSQVVN